MWPLGSEVARVVIAAAEEWSEDPIGIIEGRVRGSRARVYAFLVLSTMFDNAPRKRLGPMVGGHSGYSGTVRAIVAKAKGFDLSEVNRIRRAVWSDADDVTEDECGISTYEPHARAQPIVPCQPEPVRAPPVPDLPPSPKQEPAKAAPKPIVQNLMVTRPRVSQEVMAITEINHIPSRQSRLDSEMAMGGRMLVVPMPGEPDPSRSALAERRANPTPVVERKDGITLFTEGYNCGLHGDDQECPAYLSWLGKDYCDGWITGFNDRYLLTAPREQFDAAIEGEV